MLLNPRQGVKCDHLMTDAITCLQLMFTVRMLESFIDYVLEDWKTRSLRFHEQPYNYIAMPIVTTLELYKNCYVVTFIHLADFIKN